MEQRAPLAVKDRQDLPASGGCLDRKDQTGSLDLKDPRAPLGRMGCPATPASVENLVSKERLGLPDLQGWWDPRDPQEKRDRWESEGTQAHPDPLESRACLDHLGKKARRGIPVALGAQERMGQLDCVVSPENVACLELQAGVV